MSPEQQDVVRDLVRAMVAGRVDRDRLPLPAEVDLITDPEQLAAIRAAIL